MGEEMVVDAFAWDEVARFGVGFDVKTLEVAVENGQNELARFLYEQLATMKPQELKERRPKIYARAAYLGNKPLLNIFASLDKEVLSLLAFFLVVSTTNSYHLFDL